MIYKIKWPMLLLIMIEIRFYGKQNLNFYNSKKIKQKLI